MRLVKCLKGPVWERYSAVNVLTDPKHCWNLSETTIFLLFLSFWDELKRKTSLLVRSEILGMFDNTLTADGKYFRHYWENFAQPIQMHFSKKQFFFSGKFVAFLKSLSNFKYFEIRDESHS